MIGFLVFLIIAAAIISALADLHVFQRFWKWLNP